MRKRLSLLPHDYEFSVQQALRQLEDVCDRLVGFVGRHGADMDELGALVRDIYGHTLRGMALSVAGLSWFGRGLLLGPDCEHLRDNALKILRKLRSTGTISMSDLLKNHHLKKQERDALLERLTVENLVRVEDMSIVATTYKEFVQGPYARQEYPPVDDCWPALQAQRKGSENRTV